MMLPEQLTWKERGWLWLRLGIRLVLFLLAAWILVRFGPPLLSLFAPFLAALIAAALLNPMVKWLQRRVGWSRQGITLLLLVLLLLLLGGALAWLVRAVALELVSLVNNWDALVQAGMELMEQLDGMFRQLVDRLPISIAAPNQGLLDWLVGLLPTAAPDLSILTSYAGDKVVSISSFLLGVLFFVMATYFLTADYPYLRTRAIQNLDESVLSFLGQLRSTALGAFGGYLKAELLLSVGVFFILLVGFFVVHQPYGLLLALVLSIMDFIPIIGAGTVMVPWAVIALFTRDYSTAIEMMVIWGIIAMFRRVMEPKFVGDQTGLSPILSLVSIYVGMRLAGVLGMILGPIVLLVLLNLAGMGLFRGVRMDVMAAVGDLASILSQRLGPKNHGQK
ncbi:sporulation integral membrane protein YtvI [Flavonifractor sp. An100]|uniref:sporulation integral membrane protein YtvI n=1 Tax=Flavonifractor sp. An100 TaxID=1965538 RepID=UPI000B37FEB7|nr:sporulation integral membrane protein YtvI [Flavonifractor sp. An100]OUQ76553.1 sporulation integral membrane protein YtvI [Flavonifractor sp. An100]